MNILVCPLLHITDTAPVYCPGCHSHDHCKHGVYTRKGFHIRSGIVPIPIAIQRYRCRNKECTRCTFSVLPPMVVRYCRFFWPCLLSIARASGVKSLSFPALEISRGVAFRVAALLTAITAWVRELYREVTDGRIGTNLGRMVKSIVCKIGRTELSNRWYRQRYPRRFPAPLRLDQCIARREQHNLSLVNVAAAL
jgi:hypothetical protein